MRPADAAGIVAVNDAVGWRGRQIMVDFYAGRDDSAIFVAEVDGAIAGCGGATIFPGAAATGWVHSIVVHPERQRLGLGAALTEAAIAWLRARDAATVLLLATAAGRPVYDRLGFTPGARYGAFGWPKTTTASGDALAPRRLRPGDVPTVLALDPAATGEDRSRFLESLAATGWVVVRRGEVAGFHLPCPWGGGPTIAADADAGLAVLRLSAALNAAAPARPLGVPEENTAATRYLTDAGITTERYVTRMWLGAPPAWRPEMVFGVFNFAVA